jgi:hypothetical protein
MGARASCVLVVLRSPFHRSHPGGGIPPKTAQWPSLEAVTALEEIKQAVKGTKWAGNMWFYTIWFDYVLRYTKNLY